jgi:hypothetical protein
MCCDGLGASIKRGADMAIRQGKVLIQNAEDFYAWAKQTEENGSKLSQPGSVSPVLQ